MPIVYVHGVSVRDDREWEDLHLLLRRYIAPKIAPDPENVQITRCYWGEYGAKFRWMGGSAPTSPLRAMMEKLMTESSQKIGTALVEGKQKATQNRKKVNDHLGKAALHGRSLITKLKEVRLKDLTNDNLSEVCGQLLGKLQEDPTRTNALSLIAADDVALDRATRLLLEKCKNIDDELEIIEKLLRERYQRVREHIKEKTGAQSMPELGQKITLNIEETLARSAQAAGFGFTRAAAAIRSPMNRFVTLFMGDVLTYLHERGDYKTPGWIPSVFLSALQEARENQLERHGEPLIVMSHSMGGQIVYDSVTHFLPKLPEYQGIHIDFWAATASQVGLFEELKLFLDSSDEYCLESGLRVPFPSSNVLGYWWNVWDHNDFVSYSVKGIIEGVDDEPYNTGMFIVDAHGGYLVMPSFFRKFAAKLDDAKLHNWTTPGSMPAKLR